MLNSKPSAILQEKHVFIAKDEVCEGHLPQMKSLDDVMCTTQGACDGDFGGPLICVEGDEPVLRGIASFSPDCFKKPTVWTDVHAYLDWIADSTKVRRSVLIGQPIKTFIQQQAIKDADTRPQIIPTTTDKPLTAAVGDGLLPSDAVCERSIDGQRIIGGTLTKVRFQICALTLIGPKFHQSEALKS